MSTLVLSYKIQKKKSQNTIKKNFFSNINFLTHPKTDIYHKLQKVMYLNLKLCSYYGNFLDPR